MVCDIVISDVCSKIKNNDEDWRLREYNNGNPEVIERMKGELRRYQNRNEYYGAETAYLPRFCFLQFETACWCSPAQDQHDFKPVVDCLALEYISRN